MKVTLITKNIELTPALKDMVEKKVSKLDKYFEGNVEAKATLTVQKNRHKVEVVIPFNGENDLNRIFELLNIDLDD